MMKTIEHTDTERHTSHLTILFADISKSSNIYTLLGDRAAQNVVRKILGLLSGLTVKYGGKVLKTMGDAIMATFDATDNAFHAAKSMQKAMKEGASCEGGEFPPINIHIGIHYGSVVMDTEDIFGDAVNIAARVVDYANPQQIVATRAAIEMLPEHSDHLTKYLANITAKNIAGEIQVFEILYEDQNTTMVIDCTKLAKAVSGRLYLKRGDEVIVMDYLKPSVAFGREEFNEVVIGYSWISRIHAYIENRNGVFMLKDKSTNGTFIYPKDAAPTYIHKSEHPLAGKGVIVFGREKENILDGVPADTFEYEIR